MTSLLRQNQALREALQLLVDELTDYANKHGLGPARLLYALSRGATILRENAALAQPPESAEVVAPAESTK